MPRQGTGKQTFCTLSARLPGFSCPTTPKLGSVAPGPLALHWTLTSYRVPAATSTEGITHKPQNTAVLATSGAGIFLRRAQFQFCGDHVKS